MAKDELKEKFRRDENAELDREIDEALGGISIDDLVNAQAEPKKSPDSLPRGMRRGKVVRIDKDYVYVDLGGKSQGIVPREQYEQEPTVGEEVDVTIDRFDAREGLLILSRKGAAATNVNWDNLEEGQIVEGVVTGVNKGGLELEVKSMRAFMPAGQVDVFHVPDLNQFVGQRITAEVTQADRASRNIVLSRRNLIEREREEQKKKLMEELAEGQIRRGTVRSVMDYGAFVDLGGVDGLLHVSEISYRRGHKPSEFVKTGDIVDVKILKIDRETGKLSLSLKQARGTDPWSDAESKYATGTTITGRVTRVEQFGAFIEVEEGIEGLLPVSEMSYQRIKHPSDMVKEGDTLKLVVLSLDPANRKMSFSLKQAGPDPWKTVNDRYATDMLVNGTITRTADFGAFVELEPGLEGLVHISELSGSRVASASSAVKIGQAVRVRILEIDKDNRRISLSIKRVAELEAKPSATTPAASATPSKKKKIELRGGLDFDYKKNK